MKYQALTIIRSIGMAAARRAYHVKGKKETEDQAKAAIVEVAKQVSAKTLRDAHDEAYFEWWRRTLTGKFTQLAYDDIKQIDWLVDLEVQRPFRSRGELIAIGDFSLENVDELTEQMDTNIAQAVEERERFEEAKRIVVPIMKAHPGWTWRMAVESLAKK